MEPSSQGQTTMSVNIGSEQFSTANKQVAQVDLLPRFQTASPVSMGPQQFALAEKQFVQSKVPTSMSANFGPNQFLPTNRQSLQMGALPRSQTPMSVYFGLHPLSSINRQPSQFAQPPNIQTSMSINPGPLSSSNKRQVQMIGSPKFQVAMPPNPNFHQVSSTNKRPAQTELPPKARTETFESVRSKLRESLAAALAMVPNQQNEQQIAQKDDKSKETNGSTQKQAEVGSQPDGLGTLPKKSVSDASSDMATSSEHVGKQETTVISGHAANSDAQESQPKIATSEDEVLISDSPFIKDDLLQGHGLCWASDVSYSNEGISNPASKKPKLAHNEATGEAKSTSAQNSETLAMKIEAELFRLYGGVNKKYKEKGRSLLFNLKDRNNPELRERVMSGDIAPERLCSMTAEELASKELSQWRIAKAEELAQMVVLPDSDVDIRRLVKKTHKGEFQVEVERDDSVSVEVALGANVLAQIPSKVTEAEAKDKGKSNDKSAVLDKASGSSVLGEKADPGEQNNLDGILNEKTDLMQELMGEELKGTELLPPIVSLDEFMQALDSEPPFENLPISSAEDAPSTEEKSSGDPEPQRSPAVDELSPKKDSASDSTNSKLDSASTASKTKPSDADSVDSAVTVRHNLGEVGVKDANADGNKKFDSPYVESDTGPFSRASVGENIWEGLLQLNISSLVTVSGSFKSGEKASTKDWPSLLEIKGRVRVDAFEKFLQELPHSRSRAIMIIQFCWKEGSPENGRLSLRETADSYVADERVGFVEPSPGMEIYLCPPHKRTTEMLGRYLQKEHIETLHSAVNGLIGVVVWRRSHVIISPRISAHNKHNSTKKQAAPGRQQSVNPTLSNRNSQAAPSHGPPSGAAHQPEEDTADDIPPGFGPYSRDDDLPEFDFAEGNVSKSFDPGMVRQHTPSARPVEQMRELVHKYGQGETAKNSVLKVQPWNDDDDDDIPEWQPNQDKQLQVQPQQPMHAQPLPPPPPPPPTVQLLAHQQQNLQPVLFNQQMMSLTSLQQQLPQAQIQPQQLVQFSTQIPMPLHPPMQPQMGLLPVQQTVQPGWQPAANWLPRGPADGSLGMNGAMQPLHFGAQLGDGQFYGLPPGFGGSQNGMGWRQ